jgi:hypothetical protein
MLLRLECGVVVVHDESSPTKDKTLPPVYCSEIVDAPTVRAAIAEAAPKIHRALRARLRGVGARHHPLIIARQKRHRFFMTPLF